MTPPSCLCGECRKCKHRAYMQAWSARNPDRVKENARRTYERHAEKIRERVAEYRLANVERIREYDRERGRRPEPPDKKAARRKVMTEVRAGRLVRQPCEVCGNPKVDAHHVDYSRPLDVRWLCRRHHGEAHRTVAA